ncbi:MAG TPA: hypothetical protein PKJ99_11305 [Thermoanaerobaculales bacterium]|nr:hypothetical protein [Thermoanaerobaculales bacterium]HQL29308.1 hypothetical protein [Thermoanaerobaculales bacterium]HQN96322.1 hypothetical protein [Thermoanaerobaculales bacterium]HQP44417.1 hypothetical protein [Thermoanaerobaculales bacterium]
MAETEAPKPKVLAGLTCASCAGTIDVQEGLTNVVCRYCGTPVAVVGERGVTRLMVLDRVDRGAAGLAVRRWFAKGIRKAPALKREARLEESFLAWFPFVRARFDVVGWVLGTKEHRKKSGNRWVTEHRPVEVQVERSVDRTMESGDMAEFGVRRVGLAGDQLLPLDDELLRSRGMVFRPQRTPAEVGDALTRTAMEQVQATGEVDRVTFSWFAAIRRRTTVVYYPLWVIRYGFRGQSYQALIDAEDGTLAYGKAPGNHLFRALSLVGASAGACFAGTTLLQHLDVLLRGDNGLMALVAVGLVLAGFVAWGYRQFRRGGVVEEGTGLADGSAEPSLLQSIQGIMKEHS